MGRASRDGTAVTLTRIVVACLAGSFILSLIVGRWLARMDREAQP